MGEKFKLRVLSKDEIVLNTGLVYGNFLLTLGISTQSDYFFKPEIVDSAFKLVATSLLPAAAAMITAEDSVAANPLMDRKRKLTVQLMEGVGAFLVNKGVSMVAAGSMLNQQEMTNLGLAGIIGGAGLFLAGEKIRQSGHLLR